MSKVFKILTLSIAIIGFATSAQATQNLALKTVPTVSSANLENTPQKQNKPKAIRLTITNSNQMQTARALHVSQSHNAKEVVFYKAIKTRSKKIKVLPSKTSTPNLF